MPGPADDDDELLMDPLSLDRFNPDLMTGNSDLMVEGQMFYHTIKGGHAPSSMPGVTF